jgi:O-antigen/teichoic acid export membrane protein
VDYFKYFFYKNQSFVFIAVNILVAFLGFLRSFAFMKFFDFKELGLITLVSTAASLIGFFQIGMINGGYRIIALQDRESTNKVNNVIFSYFAVLTLVLGGFALIGLYFGIIKEWLIAIFVISIGVFALVTNWLTNTLIGAREYNRLNIANCCSALASFGSIVFAYYFGLIGAITSLLIHPLLFVSIIFFTDSKEIPTAFDFDIKYIKYILGFGFIPFLSGIFFLIYQQIERWSLNSFLGPEALGKMYLVFLTTTLWLLIPTSLNSLFFPKSVKFYADDNRIELKATINKCFLILFGYCFISGLLLLLLFYPLVEFVFPKHLPYVKLVYIVVPALILRTLSDPMVLLFNSMVKLKPILLSDIISTLICAFMILVLGMSKLFSLEIVMLCFGSYNLIRFSYLLFHYLLLKRDQKI